MAASRNLSPRPAGDDRRRKMLVASELKRSMVVKFADAPCRILEVAMHAPSARGASLRVKARYRNLLTGQVLEKNLRGEDAVDEANFERRKGQYLYPSGDAGVFMDMESYEQYEVGGDLFEMVKGYLLDGTAVQLGLYEGQVVMIEPPQVVELLVVSTPPALKGATAAAQPKDAVLETGLVVQVPPYLESGVRIKVDTRDGHFVSRA
jgi:elongation factor P